ncbi:MAG: hypothetical protein NT142_01595 [Planctomycetota bacterium]|nr:hypothetical protein [Planctomycetota bacterium]
MATRGRRTVAKHDMGKLPLLPPANLDLTAGEIPHWAVLVRSCSRHGYLVSGFDCRGDTPLGGVGALLL